MLLLIPLVNEDVVTVKLNAYRDLWVYFYVCLRLHDSKRLKIKCKVVPVFFN
jgi:hypothetical protein